VSASALVAANDMPPTSAASRRVRPVDIPIMATPVAFARSLAIHGGHTVVRPSPPRRK
jgi:hypothetical protein